MKINKNEMIRFLELVSNKGELETTQIILNISKTNMNLLTASNGNISMTLGELKGEFEDIGSIGIANLKQLLSFLKTFSEVNIDIYKEDNHLILESKKDKLKISYILKDTAYIINTVDLDKFHKFASQGNKNKFLLNKNIIEKINNYVNSLEAKSLYLIGEDKELTLNTEENEHSILASFTLENDIKGFSVRVGKNILDILDRINDNIIMSVVSDAPIYFKYEKDNINIEYVLAIWKK